MDSVKRQCATIRKRQHIEKLIRVQVTEHNGAAHLVHKPKCKGKETKRQTILTRTSELQKRLLEILDSERKRMRQLGSRHRSLQPRLE